MVSKQIGKALLALVVALFESVATPTANAAVIIQDDFTARPGGQDVVNTSPNVVNVPSTRYQKVLGGNYCTSIGLMRGLPGTALDLYIGRTTDPQMLYLPFSVNLANTAFELKITASFDNLNLLGFGNFAFGFVNSARTAFTDSVVIQQNTVEYFFSGVHTNTLMPSITFLPDTLYTFDLTYNPLLAGIAYSQPYTFSINGVKQLIPLAPTTVYTPLGIEGGIAFGSRAGPPQYRYISDLTFSTFTAPAAVPEPSTLILLGLASVGLAFAGLARRVRSLACANLAVTCMVLASITSVARAADVGNGLQVTYDDGHGHTMGYWLFVPDGSTNPGAHFPLVTFLHGSGQSGTDNLDQLTYIDGLISATRNGPTAAFLLLPQLPNPYGWGPLYNPEDLTMSILQSVVASYPVETNRLYLTGLSMGGYGALEYLSEYPHTFAAAVAMSGGGDTSPENIALIKDTPLWLFHGSADPSIPVDESIDMYNALVAAGGHPGLSIVPKGKHDIWSPIYKDLATDTYGLYPWLFSQTLATPEPSSVVLMLVGASVIIPMIRRQRRLRRNAGHDDATCCKSQLR